MTESFGKLIVSAEDERHQEFVLSKSKIALGRSSLNDVVLDDESVSRHHARLELDTSGFVLHDLGSSNGTLVNGAKVKSCTLSPGDRIQLGKVKLQFETGALPVETDITSLASPCDLETAIKLETMPVFVENYHEPCLVVTASGKTWQVPFAGEALTMGRSSENDVVLCTPMTSRVHARIERRKNDFILHDLNSSNGTWVNGEKITEKPLIGGEAIRIGAARLIFKRGFSSEEFSGLTVPAGKAEPRPVVIVPGLLGSELWLDNERIFPNLKVLVARPEVLNFPGNPGVEVRDIVSEVVIIPNVIKQDQYNRLGNYLVESLGYERGKNLLEFSYDWRQDNRASARRLAAAIEQWQARSPDARKPITVIAHSNGCLVTRYYADCLGGDKTVDRLIFMGAPHYGSPKMIASLVIGPDMLPFGLMGERLRKVLATFPTSYQVLPTYSCVVDQTGENINVLMNEDWIAEEHRALIRDARRFRRELKAHSSVPSISIFGYGFGTVTRVVVERDSQKKWVKVNCQETTSGDASVPEPSAVLKGSEIHPVRQYHGSLYTDNDVKMRLRLELTRYLASFASGARASST